jgi:hypothetical protein
MMMARRARPQRRRQLSRCRRVRVPASRSVGIKSDHAPAAIDKIAADRATHDAKPDDSTVFVMRSFPLAEFNLEPAPAAP